jgi:hypothetical protein
MMISVVRRWWGAWRTAPIHIISSFRLNRSVKVGNTIKRSVGPKKPNPKIEERRNKRRYCRIIFS